MTRDATLFPAWWPAVRLGSLVVGFVASALLAIGGWFDPQQFFRAYLSAYLFFFGLAAGSLALVMIYHLTGGAWGYLIRRFLEAAMRTMPLVAIGFLPIALGTFYLYPWARYVADGPDAVPAVSTLLSFQQIYMNAPFFWARAAVYFALWLTLVWCFDGLTRSQDAGGGSRVAAWCENLSGPGLVVYGLTLHFAAIDWIMAIEPPFHSTIFGPMVASSQLLCDMRWPCGTFALIVRSAAAGRARFASGVE